MFFMTTGLKIVAVLCSGAVFTVSRPMCACVTNFMYVCIFVCFQSLKLTESEKLQVQIQAYLDNVFDVGALLEDAENKGQLVEHLEELQEHNAQVRLITQTYTCTVNSHCSAEWCDR